MRNKTRQIAIKILLILDSIPYIIKLLPIFMNGFDFLYNFIAECPQYNIWAVFCNFFILEPTVQMIASILQPYFDVAVEIKNSTKKRSFSETFGLANIWKSWYRT